jgi:regulator of protease activity HflC (stomatin/prohibitin superfamily)
VADPTPIDFRSASRRVFGTRRGRTVYLIAGGLLVLLIAYNTCTTYILPSEVGIKQIIVGANKGIRSEFYYPGLHWVTPGAERMLTFPSHLQLLNLTNDPNERNQDDERKLPALNIQTSEGYAVTVDISVLYRIEDPYKVITTMGPGRLYEDSLVIPRAEQLLRKRLGELDAEEFYNPAKRADKIRACLEDLNAEIVPAGVRAMQIFVRRYVYDGRYQQAIEQRKIQDQTVFKNKAEADMAQAAAERDRIVAVGEAAMKVELSRGDAEKRKIDAEAETYVRKQRAAGELEVKLAEAEGTRLENEALRGAGSENMVGLKMADVLKGTRVIVVPTDGETGMNPLDLRGALKRFDVQGAP